MCRDPPRVCVVHNLEVKAVGELCDEFAHFDLSPVDCQQTGQFCDTARK